MKKKINVIDLDKTLVPFDSFRSLVLKEIKIRNYYIIALTILRKLKILNGCKYKKFVGKNLLKKKSDKYFIEFAEKIILYIDNNVLETISKYSEKDIINILISASPDFYVKHIVKKLNWVGKGSFFDVNGKFICLYGSEKVNWLTRNYPYDKYIYNFSISDSKSDIKLLSLFNQYQLWTSHQNHLHYS